MERLDYEEVKKIIKELNFQFISVKDSLDFHLKNYKNTFSKRN